MHVNNLQYRIYAKCMEPLEELHIIPQFQLVCEKKDWMNINTESEY